MNEKKGKQIVAKSKNTKKKNKRFETCSIAIHEMSKEQIGYPINLDNCHLWPLIIQENVTQQMIHFV